ncbi:hypothetical protein MKW98_020053 [Papaver atlanticum]|uniref:Polygalacturonase n=1 Tax=Papaver atlanticum TaxID=357466 RepID=A0AAD4S1N0_9MAGN|nr:hypothetical protein MKW98_020053 [Papaver atlanticum]
MTISQEKMTTPFIAGLTVAAAALAGKLVEEEEGTFPFGLLTLNLAGAGVNLLCIGTGERSLKFLYWAKLLSRRVRMANVGMNAAAFVQAWNAACHHPGGNAKLVVPPGNYKLLPVVFQGPCTSEQIVVEVQGIVAGSDDVSDYSESQWVLFENINGLLVTGGGTFDGSGRKTWKFNDCSSNPDCQPLAAGLKFMNVTKGIVKQVNSLNPQGYHMALERCNDIEIDGMHLDAPKTSPNTDGIHISASNNVRVSESTIATGGNCISVDQGSTNVPVPKVTCGPKLLTTFTQM